LKRYFTGKPCSHGHVAERFVAHGQCLECNVQWAKANPELRQRAFRKWREANREAVLAKMARYRKAHPDRAKESARKYVESHREKVREFKAAWRKANREKHNAIQKSYCDRNREKIRAVVREYDRTHPEVRRFINANRRARKRQAVGTHNRDDVAQIRTLQRDRCAYCKERLNGKGHVDHVIALANGGSNWPSNLQLTCTPCNLSKGAKDAIEFAQGPGLLL
jgi:5-methylcytosine-specific restriction endonuclease McrA